MIIPIGTGDMPASAQELQERIAHSAGALGLTARPAVSAPQWPLVQSIILDLSGSEVTDPTRFPRPESREGVALEVQRFELKANPISIQHMPCRVQANASDTAWKTARLSDGNRALVLDRAASGTLEIDALSADLERLAQGLLSEQAGKHGITVTDTKVTATSHGPRAVALRVDVTAKMMLMKTTITVTGEAAVDDALELRLSNLKLDAGGMVAGLARGFLQPHFDRLQSKPISLGSAVLGEVRLQDVTLDVKQGEFQMRARFGA